MSYVYTKPKTENIYCKLLFSILNETISIENNFYA